ncbi:MAG: GspE/PulE family protein [Candidatus Omnitrophica bacterium]|nr:GspE/PulE family protein [Candidatus Omnitrophota bacterium]
MASLQEDVNFLFSPKGMKEQKKTGDSITILVISKILSYALLMNTSDIHVEPHDEFLMVRFRIDGVLYEVLKIEEYELRNSMVSAILTQASMFADGSVRKKPQDGRWSTEIEGERVDARLSTIPVMHGEKLVMRLFRQNKASFAIGDLGCSEACGEIYKSFLTNKTGIVFVTGPTGSGKTTTLYAAINHLNNATRAISTLEDPVEFSFPGVNQSQIDLTAGFDFTSGLRSLLRQDPDIMLVGEIRDVETSEIAIRASLTGHLVLTTIHTNDAPTAITRLIDMGIAPFLLSATASLIINQRLVRKVCTQCKAPTNLPDVLPPELEPLRSTDIWLFKPQGCEACANTGYLGRSPVFEFLKTSDTMSKLILQKASTGEIREQAIRDGMVTLVQDGMRLLKEEKTTLEEILSLVIT